MIQKLTSNIFVKIITLAILFSISMDNEYCSQSIYFPSTFNTVNYNSFVSIHGLSGYDSDMIKRELAWSFIQGGFIDRDIRTNSIPKNNSLSRIGADINAGLKFAFPSNNTFGRDSLNIIISVKEEHSFAIKTNDIAYNLFFFGNENYKGETVSLDNFEYNNWGLRSLGLGLLNRKNNFLISLNLYQGITHDHYSLSNSSLTTAEDGRYLIADLNGSMFDNRYNENNRNGTKGFGIGFDGRFNVLSKASKSKLYVNITNAGVMIWPSGGEMVLIDSTYNFEGVLFNNLFSPTESNDTIPILNSVFNTEKVDANKVEFLPAKISFNLLKPISEKSVMEFSVSAFAINNWHPEVQLGLLMTMRENLAIGTQIKYGGYGGANFNLLGLYKPCANVEINSQISYLTGWLINSGYGSKLAIGIKHYFNVKSKIE